jgi:hypothetical protein
MTTPDSFGTGGVTGAGGGGLAAGPGDDQGEAAVTREAETGSPTGSGSGGSTQNEASSPGTEGGLGAAGDVGPDLTEDDEETAADH